MEISIITMACGNDRACVDPLPVYYALTNVVGLMVLGDDIYNDGDSIRNALSLGPIEFPRGNGLVLTLPAPVNGVIPTGALTVTSGGGGYPVNRANALVFWVVDPSTGADTAHGTLTTNGAGVVTAATLKYGGRPGDYTHATSRAYTDDVDLYTWCHPKAWAYRKSAVVKATGPMRKLYNLPLRRWLAGDDHDVAWNGSYPGAYGLKAPPTVDTLAKSYAFWQTASAGLRALIDQDFHNPPWADPVTPYVPNGLAGLDLTGTEPFFRVRYFYVDITVNGPVEAPCGANNPPAPGTIGRLIVPDWSFEKSNYLSGADDATRLLGSMVQEAWLDAVQASAVAGGVRSIVIASSKDAVGPNSDGFASYQTQWNRINANIHAKNYPTIWSTGDWHVPHAAVWSTANGDDYDVELVCATAFGATSDSTVDNKRIVWSNQAPDAPVLGSIVWDTDAQTTTLTIHDMALASGQYSITVPFGQRLATRRYMSAARVSRPAPSPLQLVEFRYAGPWTSRPTTGLRATERAFFSDIGQGGSEWIWDGTYWVPTAPVVLYRAAGNTAAPVATLTGVTSGTFATPGSVPAGMFVRPGMRLEMLANFGRPSGTPTATGGVTQNLGTQVNGSFTLNATGNQQVRMSANIYAVSATAQLAERSGTIQAQGTGVFADSALNCGTTAQDVTYKLASANAADTFYLLSYAVTLYP